jgi:hypothetical protein
MTSPAADIARCLADNAEAVCRRYLSNGRREGHYWMVGDVHNSPGRSLYVRLTGATDGDRPAGKWTDASSGDHGDLLDIIAAGCGHNSFRETLAEARHFLSMPAPPPGADNPAPRKAPTGSPEAARRLWSGTRPIVRTVVRDYLTGRAILHLPHAEWIRFHPHCYYRPSEDDAEGTRVAWPAMIAAVTDDAGVVTGVHRTWLDAETCDKATVAYPRRAMGLLLGNGVRFGRAGPVMAAGEGIETMLSIGQVLPRLPLIAGLSAAHLAAVAFPPGLRRLYVARDDDAAGAAAFAALSERGTECGVEVIGLEPRRGDFNADLMTMGHGRLASSLGAQLNPTDRLRHLCA